MSNCVFNFSFLSLVLYEILGWSQIYIRRRCASWMPPSGKIFIPETSTLAYIIAFLISTFQLQQFPRYQGVPNLHQVGLRTTDAPQRRNICTLSEYFTISNCVLFQLSTSSTLRERNSGEIFYTRNEYFGIFNCLFNFNLLALIVSEILGSPKFTLGCLRTPDAPCGEMFVR